MAATNIRQTDVRQIVWHSFAFFWFRFPPAICSYLGKTLALFHPARVSTKSIDMAFCLGTATGEQLNLGHMVQGKLSWMHYRVLKRHSCYVCSLATPCICAVVLRHFRQQIQSKHAFVYTGHKQDPISTSSNEKEHPCFNVAIFIFNESKLICTSYFRYN